MKTPTEEEVRALTEVARYTMDSFWQVVFRAEEGSKCGNFEKSWGPYMREQAKIVEKYLKG